MNRIPRFCVFGFEHEEALKLPLTMSILPKKLQKKYKQGSKRVYIIFNCKYICSLLLLLTIGSLACVYLSYACVH